MVTSPVVTTIRAIESQTIRTVASPAKNIGSGTTSSSGTPKPTTTSVPSLAPQTLDLAEQLNDEEKRKYVKGNTTTITNLQL